MTRRKNAQKKPLKPKKRLISRVLKPLSTKVQQYCTDNISVTSVSGVPDIVLSVAGINQPFYNFSRLASLADYGETSNYEFCKLHYIRFEFVRS